MFNFEFTCNLIFCSGLETLQMNRRHSMFFHAVNLNEMVMCLEDLINYFAQPEDDMGTSNASIILTQNCYFLLQNMRKNKIVSEH